MIFDTVVEQRVNIVDIKDNGKLVARLHTHNDFLALLSVLGSTIGCLISI